MSRRQRAAAITPRTDHWRTHVVLLALAAMLAYANGLHGPFIMDDHTAVVSNATIRSITPLTTPLSPPPETPVAARPLVNLTFAFNYALGGLDVRGYHATNLAIHVLAAFVLLGVLRRTLALPGIPPVLAAPAHSLAFVCALLWLLHPLQTEVVNYVTQRTSSMMGLLYLLTLYCSIRALQQRASTAWHVSAVLACAAGMACKEAMVTAPVMVVVFDRVFVFRTLAEAMRRRWPFYASLAATWGLLALLMAQGHRTTVGFDAGVDAWTYLLNQAVVIPEYLKRALLPRGLVADYGIPVALTLRDVAAHALVVVALGVVSVLALVWRPRLGFLGVWFFVTLAPASSIVPIVTEVGAERRMYLPLAAIVVLAVCGARAALARIRAPSALAVAACAVAGIGLGAGTVTRNAEYDSRLTLAQTVVERRPHGRAYLRYAGILVEAGRRSEAIDYLEAAKTANAVGARFLLGNEHLADGRLDEAIEELAEFIARHPRHASALDARQTLARAHVARGTFQEAASEYARLLELAPGRLAVREELADVLLALGQPEKALPHLELVASAAPHDVNALGKLGTALFATGHGDDAVAVLRRAVASDPRHARARSLLGRALAAQGRFDMAIVHLREAVALAPGDEAAKRDLAAATRSLTRR